MMNTMLYFFLSLTTVLAVMAGPVLDIDGNIILDGSYYALPHDAIRGGLNLLPDRDHQCHLYVGQKYSELDIGIPVKFSNWKSRVRYVPESENLNIEMDDVTDTFCGGPIYWRISAGEVDFGASYVTGGPKPEPGEGLSKSLFKIKKVGENPSSYEIEFCPDNDECVDVGMVHNPHHFLCLGFSNWARYSPLQVVFVKANGTETLSSKTTSII